MLELLYGPPGSGKTKTTLDRLTSDLEAGLESVVLVPEQQVVAMEGLVAAETDRLGAAALDLEVLSFRRLANAVFRKFGGLCYRYASEGGRQLLLWQVLRELAPSLQEYRSVHLGDRRVISALMAEIQRFERTAVSPSQLEETAKQLSQDGYRKLAGKLEDLSVLYAGYRILFQDPSREGDPDEDLSRLCLTLERPEVKEYFCEKKIYVDGFSDFTGREYEVLRRLLECGADVTVTVGLRPSDHRLFLSKVDSFQKTLCRIASHCHPTVAVHRTILEENHLRPAALHHIEENFYRSDAAPFPKDGDASPVALYSCRSPYEEAEAVACRILADVQTGGKFRNHAVVVRDTARYEGILRGVFERCEIPCFFSVRGSLLSRSAIRAVLAAVDVIRTGYRTDEVLSYVKTGFSGLTDDEGFAFEEYVAAWSVSGRRFYEEPGFTMNPSGYTDQITDEDKNLLEELNGSRRKVILPLRRLQKVFDEENPTVAAATEALYRFLSEIGLCNRLQEEAVLSRKSGRERDAEELAQLWNALCESLDELHSTVGQLLCTPALYGQMLQTVLTEKNVGSIPTAVDEVVFSDALLLRGNGIPHLHLLGANDGVFPAEVSETGLFGDADLKLLQRCGLDLGGDTVRLCEEELYTFYRAVSLPSKTLSISYARQDLKGTPLEPSSAFLSLCRLFSMTLEDVPSDEAQPLLSRLYHKNASLKFAKEALDCTNRDATQNALLSLYAEDAELQDRLARVSLPISAAEERLSGEVADAVYGERVSLTQSRMESFIRCPFAYTLKYLLKLNEEKSADVKASDVGTLMHLLLERFLRRLKEEDRLKGGVSDGEIRSLAEEIFRAYQERVCGDAPSDARFAQLLRRLKKTAELLLTDLRDEFCQSSFTPICFELPVGSGEAKDQITLPPVRFPLENGGEAVLCGIVDRVDAMKRGRDVYLRVVDYKTGLKELKMEHLDLGLDLQMLLYMMALCSSDSPELKKLTGLEEGGRYRPAGVLYYEARRPKLSAVTAEDDPAKVKQKAVESLARNGILLCDEDILRCMDGELAGRFIPAERGKKGELKGKNRSFLREEQELDALLYSLPPKVTALAEKIRLGVADADPLKEKDLDGCLYCEMYPICRKRGTPENEEEGDEES